MTKLEKQTQQAARDAVDQLAKTTIIEDIPKLGITKDWELYTKNCHIKVVVYIDRN